jgi:hypothetical protein
MSLILSGTTGVADVDGSAATPAIRGTDANTGIFFPAADTIGFAEGGVEAMRIDSSGNLLMGTTSTIDSGKLSISANGVPAVAVSGANFTGFSLRATGTGGRQYIISTTDNANGLGGGLLSFYDQTANAFRAGIDSSGRMLINATTAFANGQNIQVGSGSLDIGTSYRALTNGNWAVAFYNTATSVVGQIVINAGSTSYNTASDYRLKEQVQPMTGALARNALLNPVKYKWKTDGSDGEGFIAHELQGQFPGAVSGSKDAVDADGNPVYQGIGTGPLDGHFAACVNELTALIQEQQALITSQSEIITALTARVEALEGQP